MKIHKEFSLDNEPNDNRWTVFCTSSWYKENATWNLDEVTNTVVVDTTTDRVLKKSKIDELEERIHNYLLRFINPEDYK